MGVSLHKIVVAGALAEGARALSRGDSERLIDGVAEPTQTAEFLFGHLRGYELTPSQAALIVNENTHVFKGHEPDDVEV